MDGVVVNEEEMEWRGIFIAKISGGGKSVSMNDFQKGE